MNLRFFVVLGLAACAAQRAAWEAQQRADQPTNMELLCKSTVNTYCAHCGITDQAACGQVYVTCLGGHSPADASAFTQGQVDQCVLDVNGGDCAVMPQVWPASCSVQTPTPAPAQQQCSGNATWDGTQCVCPTGASWDGTQCVCPATAVWDGTQCSCPAGASWDGTQCVCPAGATWDGTQCTGAAAPAPEPQSFGKRCRAALIKKGYAPDQLGNCEGVTDRCATALIAKGYGPDQLANCRGVEGGCAEQLIAKGYGPDQLANCRR